ncbi:MFS transporter [Streptomyces hirsutus]|uniref:MFS transporter n=1 Tax=Streptomyces hirsutus TaxID=35620 RepID=UPI0024AFE0CE|nr:MFS transporter [Streptomyces hirsutus]
MLAGAMSSPILGKLADMHGKRRVLLLAVTGAAVGAVVSAVAPTFGWFLVGRALQGLLGPSMFLTYSLMRDVFPPQILALAVSIVTAGLGIILIPAPWVTGWLLDHYGFRGIFWFFAIALVVLAVAIRLTTEESTVRTATQAVDYLGAVLLGAGLVGVLTGVSFGTDWGCSSARTVAFIVAGVALLALWVITALRTSEPLIDLRFFARRSVGLTALASGLGSGMIGGFATLLPIMVMMPTVAGLGYGFGTSAEGYAIYQAPWSIASVLAGLGVGFAVRRIGSRRVLMTSAVPLALAALGAGLMHDSRGLVVVWAAVFGIGQGLLYSGAANAVIDAVPASLQGSMASMVQVVQLALGAVVPVVLFAIMNGRGVTVVQGAVLYRESGVTTGFVVLAAVAALAGIAARWLPHGMGHQAELPLPAPSQVLAAEA